MSSITPTQTFTTHSADGSITSKTDPITFSPFDSSGALSAATVFTTHTLPVVLDDDDDIKRHQAWLASGPTGIGVKGGVVAVMNKFAPGAECPAHRTQTIDFGVVVEGELELVIPDGENKVFKRGDVIVQRGTFHGWRNPSTENQTLVFFVALESKPVQVGDKLLGEDFSNFANM
ncbi:hypothetical protein ABW19_dt0208622 [Dactylella cylindrospora]|nr:hypothetical protein ABW19_dt0208622 [Dactylella cylindrospora]